MIHARIADSNCLDSFVALTPLCISYIYEEGERERLLKQPLPPSRLRCFHGEKTEVSDSIHGEMAEEGEQLQKAKV